MHHGEGTEKGAHGLENTAGKLQVAKLLSEKAGSKDKTRKVSEGLQDEVFNETEWEQAL